VKLVAQAARQEDSKSYAVVWKRRPTCHSRRALLW